MLLLLLLLLLGWLGGSKASFLGCGFRGCGWSSCAKRQRSGPGLLLQSWLHCLLEEVPVAALSGMRREGCYGENKRKVYTLFAYLFAAHFQ
jgi:hypothetical protein